MTRRVFVIEAAVAVVIGVVIMLATGCSGQPADAGTPKPPGWETVINVGGNDVGYNVDSFCNHGNRIYVVDRGFHGIGVAANDPSCAGVAK